MPTVACINGHAYGAGLFLALICDYRIMRADRGKVVGDTQAKNTILMQMNHCPGFLCFPEVSLGLPLGPQFAAVAKGLNPTLAC